MTTLIYFVLAIISSSMFFTTLNFGGAALMWFVISALCWALADDAAESKR
jgi:hypothetical protein